MKKITRKDFEGLRQQYPVLTQDEMRRYVDGYSDSSCNGDWFASELYLSDFGVSVFSSGGYGGYDDSYEFEYWGGNTGGGGGGTGDHNPSTGDDKYGEIWQKIKSICFEIANALGVDLSGVQIELGSGRAAYAWRQGDKIIIGYGFFEGLSCEYDRTSTLIHEKMHLQFDDLSEIIEIPTSGVLGTKDSVPDYVKEYIDLSIERGGGVTSMGYDFEFNSYIDYVSLKSPVYYENELRAYEHEIEICPDSMVSSEYALERKYKVWKYKQLLQEALKIQN